MLAVEYPAAFAVVLGALQPAGTARVTLPLIMPAAAAVYVNVIVRPVCDAEKLPTLLVIVPEPSAASVGVRATRCATHCALADTVAVLAPVAAAAACVASAPVVRARLAGPLPEIAVYSCATVWPASCASVTFPCAP